MATTQRRAGQGTQGRTVTTRRGMVLEFQKEQRTLRDRVRGLVRICRRIGARLGLMEAPQGPVTDRRRTNALGTDRKVRARIGRLMKSRP